MVVFILHKNTLPVYKDKLTEKSGRPKQIQVLYTCNFVSDQSSLGELIGIGLKWDYNNHGSLHFVVLSKQPIQINTGYKAKFAPPVGLRFAPPVTMPAVGIRI